VRSGGKRTGSGRKGDKSASGISIGKVTNRAQAFAAARKVLEFCMTEFVKPGEKSLTAKLEAACAALAK
jgi:hypothetical protein